MRVCACARVRVCACARVRVFACVRVWVCACARVRACARARVGVCARARALARARACVWFWVTCRSVVFPERKWLLVSLRGNGEVGVKCISLFFSRNLPCLFEGHIVVAMLCYDDNRFLKICILTLNTRNT